MSKDEITPNLRDSITPENLIDMEHEDCDERGYQISFHEDALIDQVDEGLELQNENPNFEIVPSSAMENNQLTENVDCIEHGKLSEDNSAEKSDENDADDGWIYDSDSGYWIQKTEESYTDTSVSNEDVTVEDKVKDKSEDTKDTSICISKEKELGEADTEEISEEHIKELKEGTDVETKTPYNEDVVIHEQDKNEQSKEVNRIDMENNNISEENEIKIRRKIKISVSVTDHDQVNCDSSVQSDPVSLDKRENYEEISEASQNAEDSSKNIGKKEGIQSDNEVLSVKLINNDNKNIDAFTGAGKLQHNGDKKQEESVNTSTKIVIASDGIPTEVKMRGPMRRYSTKTASFRWSGAEMIQIDGPQAVINNSEDH